MKYELLLAPFTGWVVAQGLKYILTLRKDGAQLSDLFSSGGFPSSHTAFMIAATALQGMRYGLDDRLFAVLALISAIVMYDAMGVRRASGEQGKAIKEIAKLSSLKLKTTVHSARGHTPQEVAGGFIVGVVIAYLFNLL